MKKLLFISLLIGFILSILALKYDEPITFTLIAIVWFFIFIRLMLTTQKSIIKNIYYNLAFTILLLGILEMYSLYHLKYAKSQYRSETTVKDDNSSKYIIENKYFGYGPTKDIKINKKRFYNETMLYSADYTIENGLRITPSSNSNLNDECIIFFGGSFTFGEGVNDQESMPYIVGSLQNKKVYNWGFGGYGPHQMLATIDNEMINCEPNVIIYQAIEGHIVRSAGKASWDKVGPKYILDNGILYFSGFFDDTDSSNINQSSLIKKINNQLEKSYLYKKYILKEGTYFISDYDVQLYNEIIATTQKKILAQFSESEFHIILWDKPPGTDEDFFKNETNDNNIEKMINEFKRLNIKFHLISNILPNYFNKMEKYEISQYDKHPNALAHQLIADYVVKNIINKQGVK